MSACKNTSCGNHLHNGMAWNFTFFTAIISEIRWFWTSEREQETERQRKRETREDDKTEKSHCMKFFLHNFQSTQTECLSCTEFDGILWWQKKNELEWIRISRIYIYMLNADKKALMSLKKNIIVKMGDYPTTMLNSETWSFFLKNNKILKTFRVHLCEIYI